MKRKLGQGHFPSSCFILSLEWRMLLPLHLLCAIHISVGLNLTCLPTSRLPSRLKNSHLFFSSWKDAVVWLSVCFFLLMLASSLTFLLRWLKPHTVIKMCVCPELLSDTRSFLFCSDKFSNNSAYLICLFNPSLCWHAYKPSISFWVIIAR